MTKLEKFFYSLSPVQSVLKGSRKRTVYGAEGATVYEVGRFFFKELHDFKLNERAAAVTYNFLMAMPPAFLFLFSLVPYLPLSNVEQTILNTIKLVAPNDHIYKNVSGVITDFMHKQRKDILSVGIIMSLFFSSNGILGLMRSFDRNTTLYKKRTRLKRRWTAVKLTFLIICVAITSLAVLIIQTEKLNKLVLRVFHNIMAVKILSVIILVLLIFIAISIIYVYGPSLTHKFKFVSTGSIFATVLSLATTSVFFFLVNNFINYNKVYGSIGTLIAFMVWVWLNTLVILIGYELNVSILLGRLSQRKNAEENKKD